MADFVAEPAREVPVSHSVDVVVAGGGTAGIAAAVCAARMGLSTVMIERTATPGGMVTQVICWLSDFDNKGGFATEFLTHINDAGICTWPYYNPFAVVPFFDRLVEDSGVTPLYLAQAVAPLVSDDGCLEGVVVESKSGRHAIRAKVVIDATGDGDIAARAGADFQFGRDSDGAWQAITSFQLMMNYTGGMLTREEFNEVVRRAAEKAGIEYSLPYDRGAVRVLPGTQSAYWCGVPHVVGCDPLTAEGVSQAVVGLRKQADELFHLLAEHAEPFKGIDYGPSSPIPGVRESRRIVCDANVTYADTKHGARREDGLFIVTQAIDIHKCLEDEPAIYVERIEPYHVPYGALLPKGLENILVVGRCIGGDHESLASYRIMADCYAMGEAAAIAAKMACDGVCSLREISVAGLVAEMASRGYGQ